MKKLFAGPAMLLVMASGTVTWIFMLLALIHWWGGLGIVASFFLTPGVVIFPFVYWIVENQFPLIYFIAWGVGIFGLIIGAFSET